MDSPPFRFLIMPPHTANQNYAHRVQDGYTTHIDVMKQKQLNKSLTVQLGDGTLSLQQLLHFHR